VVTLAAVAAAGAWWSHPFPLAGALAVVAVGWIARRAVVVIVGVALTVSALGARSWAGLHPPLVGWYSGAATLAGDPVDVDGALRVDMVIRRKRVEAWARGAAASALRDRLSGEEVWVAGRVRPLPARLRRWLASRHVAARLSVRAVDGWMPGTALTRFANGLRRTLLAGAASLRPDRRALFAGFVLGDDRGQPAEIVADFRASGLTHLLVVSGENVAFVLALASPLLSRLRLVSRVFAGVAVLVLFGTLVRWEPSVIRAEAMATLALMATAIGRPLSRIRLLALAVTLVLLLDPLLVHSAGFLMSVGASAGIALLAGRVAERLPGPRPLAAAMGVTIGAQVGVAPVLIPVFGSLPLAALPANLLAVPAAGPIMTWGLAAGVPAGLVGGHMAALVHVPTAVLVAWIAAVARVMAGLPFGRMGAVSAAGVVGAGVVAVIAKTAALRVGMFTLALAFVIAGPVVGAMRPPDCRACAVAGGVRMWRSGGDVVLVADEARSSALLWRLWQAGVRRVDLLVVRRATVPAARAVEVLSRRVMVSRVVAGAPRSGREAPPGWRIVAGDASVTTRRFRVVVRETPRGLDTDVEQLPSPS